MGRLGNCGGRRGEGERSLVEWKGLLEKGGASRRNLCTPKIVGIVLR